jgi:hypothetical protein
VKNSISISYKTANWKHAERTSKLDLIIIIITGKTALVEPYPALEDSASDFS